MSECPMRQTVSENVYQGLESQGHCCIDQTRPTNPHKDLAEAIMARGSIVRRVKRLKRQGRGRLHFRPSR